VPASAVRRRDDAAVRHAEVFRRTFERQEAAITSTTKAAKSVEWDRWNRELQADLFAVAVVTSKDAGERVARQLRGRYDERRTYAWLAQNARAVAENVNAATAAALAEAADPAEVFEHAKTVRADLLGMSRATQIINWSRLEAAKQNPDGDKPRTKTWVVTSPNSRHPEFSGLTARVGEQFGNGAEYPGDGALGADDTANCHCVMRID
jgi:hypothetical protein